MHRQANDRGLQDWELSPARQATMQDLDMEKVEAHLHQHSTRHRQTGRFDDVEQVLIEVERGRLKGIGQKRTA